MPSKFWQYLFLLIFAFILIAKALVLWTDYLWFGVMGQSAVFSTILWTRVKLGVIVGVVFFLWLWLNLRYARKPLPPDITLIGRRLLPDEERAQIDEYADRGLLIFSLVGGLMAGLVASSKWLPWLQYTHPVSFGDVDPLFNRDAGFYVFQLGFLRYLARSAFYAVVIALVTSVLVHLYQEAIRVAGNTIQTTTRARTHVYCLVALALLVKVWAYRLDMLNLVLTSHGGIFRGGAAYADVHARLPVMWLLMGLCVVGAGIVLANVRSRRLFWPAGSLAVILLVSFLGGTVYPALVQRLVVLPTQLEKEERFIRYNIEATNRAFGLDKVRNETHRIRGELTLEDVQKNRATIENIRLWDHRPLEKTMDQTQALRAYYDFPDVDVDRYWVNGQYRQVMIAPRQIDSGKIPPPRTWVKDRLQYTHGYGVAAAPVNEIARSEADEGLPSYWVKDIPPVSVPGLEIERPGIYYYTSIRPRLIEIIQKVNPRTRLEDRDQPTAEGGGGPESGGGPPSRPGAAAQKVMDEPLAKIEDYVVVNTDVPEIDYSREEGGAGEHKLTRYQGRGGVPLSSFMRRLAFAVRFYDLQLLLTQSINANSRIIINRTLPECIQTLCPLFLICDPDPYITIIDKQLKWINDVYTYSTHYPYSAPHPLVGVNYLRNSVKVVCDAYDGIPEFYIVDPSDPLVRCYQSIFPTLLKSEPLPPRVREHIRYPQLLFMVQVEMYADYHMRDPATFYQREDSWAIATELYGPNPTVTEAYYVVMKLPGESKEEFLIMLPMTLRGREDRNMVAWMAARCDGDKYGELVCYRMPPGTLVDGPMQVESRIGQNRDFSAKQTLWSQRGSNIIRGNLLVIPIENSLLYVEPVYIAAANSAIPQLKLVILATSTRIALGVDLNDALRQLFGPGAAEPAQPAPTTGPGTAQPPAPAAGLSAELVQLIARALQLETDSKTALAQGNLGEYQRLQNEQAELLKQIQAAAK